MDGQQNDPLIDAFGKMRKGLKKVLNPQPPEPTHSSQSQQHHAQPAQQTKRAPENDKRAENNGSQKPELPGRNHSVADIRQQTVSSSHGQRPPPPNPNREVRVTYGYITHLEDRARIADEQEKDLVTLVKEKLALQSAIEQYEQRFAEEKNKQDAEVRQLQQAAFGRLGHERWEPWDDSAVSLKLSTLRDKITQLAKTYAVEDLSGLPRTHYKEFVTALRDVEVMSIPNEAALLELLRAPHFARLSLTGLLSNTVHRTVFGQPFFFMTDGQEDAFDKLPKEYEHLADRTAPSFWFESMFKAAEAVDQRAANIWRSDTLRILQPDVSETSEAAEKLRHDMYESREERCRRSASHFERGIAKMLVTHLEPPSNETYRNSLVSIFEEADALAMRLWTQRTAIRCWYYRDLARWHFRVDSDLLQAHALHKLDDPDDRSLDGKLIKLVAHPAVLRFGTHEGEKYDESAVWAKAVVWLDA